MLIRLFHLPEYFNVHSIVHGFLIIIRTIIITVNNIYMYTFNITNSVPH